MYISIDMYFVYRQYLIYAYIHNIYINIALFLWILYLMIKRLKKR